MNRSFVILILIALSLPLWSQNQGSEIVDVVSFGQRVQARVDEGVYLLKELWDMKPWLQADSGQIILGYEVFDSEKGAHGE